MRNFRDNRGGGGGRFGKRNFGGNRGGYGGGNRDRRDGDTSRPGMHKATCAECGKPCEVPFRPTGDRPIFCSDCFGKQEGRGSSPREKKFDRPRFENKRPDFRPATPAQDTKAFTDIKQQLELMNNKIERILSLVMQTPPTTESAPEKKTEPKTKKAKAKKTTAKKKK